MEKSLEYIVYKEKRAKLLRSEKGGKTGFCNIGNTCYVNCVLQSIMNNKNFRAFILQKFNKEKHKNSELLNKVRDLTKNYWSGKYEAINPEDLINVVQAENNDLIPWEQQDAHEFLVTFLSVLHEETMVVDIEMVNITSQKKKSLESLQMLLQNLESCKAEDSPEFRTLMNFFSSFGNEKERIKGSAEGCKDNSHCRNQHGQKSAFDQKSKDEVKGKIDVIRSHVQKSLSRLEREIKLMDGESKPERSSAVSSELQKENGNGEAKEKAKKEKAENEKIENKSKERKSDNERNSTTEGQTENCLKENAETKSAESEKVNESEEAAIETMLSQLIKTPSPKRETRNSSVKDLFYGVLVGEVSCSVCHRKSQNRTLFSDLPLELAPDEAEQGWLKSFFNSPRYSVESCLRHFCGSEGLGAGEMYLCMHCRLKVKALKSFFVEKAPETLILHLKRFAHHKKKGSHKLQDFVSFPLELDLAPYVRRAEADCAGGESEEEKTKTKTKSPAASAKGENSGEKASKDSTKGDSSRPPHKRNSEDSEESYAYSLSAVVEHIGGSQGGHFIAYCKHPVSGVWREFNDRFVKVVRAEEVLKKQAYVLFYEKKTDRKKIESNVRLVEKILNSKPKSEKTHLVSTSWMQKVLFLEDPGLVDNREIVCRHGNSLAALLSTKELSGLAQPVTEEQWSRLLARFGQKSRVATVPELQSESGDGHATKENGTRRSVPMDGNEDNEEEKSEEVEKVEKGEKDKKDKNGETKAQEKQKKRLLRSRTKEDVCGQCKAEGLLRRKKFEKNKVLTMEKTFVATESSLSYLVSESWMSSWRAFVNDESDVIPGPIYNEHLLDENSNLLVDLEVIKDFRIVPKNVWLFLLEIYGGGPEVINNFIKETDCV